MRSQALRSAAIRVGALRLALLLVFLVLAGRAGQLAILNAEGRHQGDAQVHARMVVRSARGLVLDRDQVELAISVDAPSIYVIPKLLKDRDHSLAALAAALGISERSLTSRLHGKRGFTYVARWVSEAQAEAVRALQLGGVGIEREPRRRYPAGLAASLVGFADIDGKGVRGIEQMLDGWLRGRPRVLSVERDAKGRLLTQSPMDPRLAAGGDVMISIDAGLQGVAEAALEEAIEATGAQGGVVITVAPKTGDILALAEAPGFDPNEFRHTDYRRTGSAAFLDAVEPGSTFKAFLVALALDQEVITPDQTFDTGEGWMRVPGKTIRDHRAYGVLDPTGILMVSSNVGSVQIAQLLGPEAHFEGLRRFGFGQPTHSGFPMESAGLLRPWRDWKPLDHATIAFGHGVSVTSMQLAMAISALANEGELMAPRLLLARRRPMDEWKSTEPVSLGQAVRPETARTVLGMMEHVVSAEGTGRLAALAGVRVAGKTGTAQKFDPQAGRYSSDRYIAWFMGVAPADDPRLAVVVALDEPRGERHTGGAVAAPLFADVAAAQLAHRGILTRPEPIPARRIPIIMAAESTAGTEAGEVAAEPSQARVQSPAPADRPAPPPIDRGSGSEMVYAQPKPRPDTVPPAEGPATAPQRMAHQTVFVPDFQGASLERARALAARESLQLHVEGTPSGRVVHQVPAPGTIMDGGDRTVIVSVKHEGGQG